MADEPLDRRILREIRDRLAQSRAAVEEYERLEAALAALAALDASTGEAPRASRPRRARSAPSRPRAPRGANRDKALEVIADRPGITVAELSSATGIPRNVLYSLTRGLTERRRIERVSLPGDSFGFRIVQAEAETVREADGDGAAEAAPKRPRRGRRQAAAEEPAAAEPAGEGAEDAADEPAEAAPDESPAAGDPAPA
jgi:hypothetical protein